jgi:flagellar hook-basal body protein
MSFYTSLTGLNAASSQLSVTSNNIANVGTAGFKRSIADFGDIFSTSPLQKASSNIGQGVSLEQVSQEFTQGNISSTGNSLDLAISGDGFFPLKSADHLQDIYTRNGAFSLNDQNNVVTSSGQSLMAASVDSTGKADLTNLSPLTIPPKTTGQAVETTKIQLGLNLPAGANVITAPFDRTNPATYNNSTAMTVYDAAGNGYLATVYYVKTQNASQASPVSRWQTYFYVGDTQVNPSLQQATNAAGNPEYVDKYGNVVTKDTPGFIPPTGTTAMYVEDQQNTIEQSASATTTGTNITDTSVISSAANAGKTISFNMNVDGQSSPTQINYTLQSQDSNPTTLAKDLQIAINNTMGTLPTTADQRFGVAVSYDTVKNQFSIASGSTGDASSISVSDLASPPAGTVGLSLLNMASAPAVAAATGDAVRGVPSTPAKLVGTTISSTNNNVLITPSNENITVTVDGIYQSINIPPGAYTLSDLASTMQGLINGSVDSNTGQKITGVSVAFVNNQLTFTTSTTGSNSSILVSGDASLGLANPTATPGATSTWKPLVQYTKNGVDQYVNNGTETEDSSQLSTGTKYWPLYLTRGELSFDLTGKPVSPLSAMPFDTAFLQGGKAALTMSIDFTKSSQTGSNFSVISQSQDGAPEGDLMSLNIGNDGLVSATYSNGSQESLGKIVLANFSSPTGLRQMGNASYLSSATSGTAKIGEAGSAGFGSIRAGATEQANVDLTQELVDLITAQRNFQANAKAIETDSTMTQAVINIRN